MPTEKRNILTGGLILITLGVLIFISKTSSYSFGQTWPILLIVIGISTLIYRFKAIEGWFIATVGVIFLFIEFYGFDLYKYSQFILPIILVLLGVYVLLKRKH
ncbi:MAG: putative rane protein [Deltaproteobacteria bacterium]|nr:putative rane protein [Deltaproteobacteria bacterium]